MSRNYSSRLTELRNRRNDLSVLQEAYGVKGYTFDSFSQYIKKSKEKNDVENYFFESMMPVDKIYTDNTVKEADRVKNQLDKMKRHL